MFNEYWMWKALCDVHIVSCVPAVKLPGHEQGPWIQPDGEPTQPWTANAWVSHAQKLQSLLL